jgi:hypothetical protein
MSTELQHGVCFLAQIERPSDSVSRLCRKRISHARCNSYVMSGWLLTDFLYLSFLEDGFYCSLSK